MAAKLVGAWLGLVAPLAIPFALSLVLLIAFSIPMTLTHWIQLAGFLGISLLFVTFFIAYGTLISTLTKRSNVSFLFSLVSWVLFVLIIPRAGVMLAGQIVRVPTVAEMESQQDSYAKNLWNEHMKDLTKNWRDREASMQGLNAEQRKAKRDEMEWTWAEQDDALRKKVQADIDENARVLQEGVRNKKIQQQKLAFAFARLSPVSAYQLAVMNLSGTDIDLKTRYEDALNSYRTTFNQYKDKKAKESGATGGIRITFDSNTGLKIDTGREMALDLTGMPQFQPAEFSMAGIMGLLPVDIGLLFFFTMLAVVGGFIAFLRYDVR